jgi:hypothetical protein
VFTYSEECRVPIYPRFDEAPFYTLTASEDALRYPVERASFNSNPHGGHTGYGYYALMNHAPEYLLDYYDSSNNELWPSQTESIFKLAQGTAFVSNCTADGDTFSATYEQRALADGTYIFPHAFAEENTVWTSVPDATERSGYRAEILTMKHRSIGMSPLYPVIQYNDIVYAPDYLSLIDTTSSFSAMTATTFLGLSPRCTLKIQMKKKHPDKRSSTYTLTLIVIRVILSSSTARSSANVKFTKQTQKSSLSRRQTPWRYPPPSSPSPRCSSRAQSTSDQTKTKTKHQLPTPTSRRRGFNANHAHDFDVSL